MMHWFMVIVSVGALLVIFYLLGSVVAEKIANS